VTATTIAGAALDPDEAQRTFRAVLDALSRPGTPHRLPPAARDRVPAALLPALALADLTTPVCVLGEVPSGHWQDALVTITSAPVVPLRKARLVAALRPVTPAELLAVARGTAAAPEDGALLTAAVSGVDSGGAPLRLTGPGVAGTRLIAPGGLPAGWLAARDEAVAGFPAGIDLLLVGPDGRVLAIPRSSRVEEG